MSKAQGHWIFMRDDILILHTENRDYRAGKRALEIEEREISREEVKVSYGKMLPEVDAVLSRKRAHTHSF